MKSTAEIERALTAEIADILDIEEKSISPNTSIESLGIDSFRLMELLIFIEKEFGISLINAGLQRESLQNVSSLASCVALEMKK